MKKVTFFILVAILFFGGVATLSAQTTKWTGNVSNVWSDSGNWNNGVPNMNKTAVIGWFSPSKPDPVIFSNTNFKKFSEFVRLKRLYLLDYLLKNRITDLILKR